MYFKNFKPVFGKYVNIDIGKSNKQMVLPNQINYESNN